MSSRLRGVSLSAIFLYSHPVHCGTKSRHWYQGAIDTLIAEVMAEPFE
jgi:hypothetical protein